MRIAAFCCARQIWIPEIEYYQNAQIGPQGAEKQLRKVVVGGWWWWVGVPILLWLYLLAGALPELVNQSLSI